MPDNLTDKEIVNDAKQVTKALEYCVEGDCEKCPYDEQTACNEYLKLDAVKVINRLQEENERLCQIGGNLLSSGSKLFQETKAIKAEAYKEFAERLKEETYILNHSGIDNLLKELVGEDNATK